MNQLARALNMTSASRVDSILNGAVSHSSAFIGGVAQAGLGDPKIKGVPGDLAVAAVLHITGNPLASTIANGLTVGALGRFGTEFGRGVHAARLLKGK